MPLGECFRCRAAGLAAERAKDTKAAWDSRRQSAHRRWGTVPKRCGCDHFLSASAAARACDNEGCACAADPGCASRVEK